MTDYDDFLRITIKRAEISKWRDRTIRGNGNAAYRRMVFFMKPNKAQLILNVLKCRDLSAFCKDKFRPLSDPINVRDHLHRFSL